MVRRIPVLLVVVALVGGFGLAGVMADQSERPKEDDYELHKLLVDTLDQVERNYVKDISRRELIEAAIQGILDKLDPYSAYISPKELDEFRTSVDGNFGGIGIQIAVEDGQLKVLSPLVGTPAYRAGMMAGDRILEIDGKSTEGIDHVEEAVRQLKGEAGSQVSLTVLHPNQSEKEPITLTREIIRVDTVLGDHRNEDDHWDFLLDRPGKIGYVRITAFSRGTAGELRRTLEELKKREFRGLILDLRFNPGGLLGSAVEVSDLFVSQGRIVSTEGRAAPERSWDAKESGTLEGFPMVVLVNRYSASASEIVAACLQDHKRAVVMGERTWGKGSVQNVIELERRPHGGTAKSALKLTTASYHRPSGKKIHRFPGDGDDDEWGVVPNDGYLLKLSDEEMVALIRDRSRRDVLQPKPPLLAQVAESGQEPPAAEVAVDPQESPDAKPQSPAGEEVEGQPTQPEETGMEPPEEPKAADAPAADPEPSTPEPAKPDPPDSGLSDPQPSEFVDPQLRMAIDYLAGELARAD